MVLTLTCAATFKVLDGMTLTSFLGRVLKLEVGMCPNLYYSRRDKHSISLLTEGLAPKILLVSIMMILSMMSRQETYFLSMVSMVVLSVYSQIWKWTSNYACPKYLVVLWWSTSKIILLFWLCVYNHSILEGFIQLLHNHVVWLS